MTTQLLIDADFVLYRDCCVVRRDHVWTNLAGQKVHTQSASHDEALEKFTQSVESYVTKLHADEAILVFSGDANFRKDVWPQYKSGRASLKPPAYWAVIDSLREAGKYRVVSEPCLEGDDYIGILATRPSGVRRVIVSEDKDMQTLPETEIWRQDKLVETTEESADHFWRLQTLMGDTTDGYHGCPGLGPVSAAKVLEKPGDPWENILEAYRKGCAKKPEALTKAGVETPDDLALLNARLARILRHTDWDGAARRPILWSPEE
ncbi:exonuclease [Sphingomonas desiccabilis]|uniref:Exonuclease n=1 Tax=Sphingomonas desiccabilis TaxID=429134 RepID=A0A4V1QPS5_9SPHN|nr:exonuclease [Sphingomonas desiccabilis]MBB3910133.1 DNA polymerase-1 [Sphingomonas desiccabilis]RXZ34817.1 exonuclease [Sphingomonas desiccabilis]